MQKEREDFFFKTDEGLKKFQSSNCVGCRFADKEFANTGKPCCTKAGTSPIVISRLVCLSLEGIRPSCESPKEENK